MRTQWLVFLLIGCVVVAVLILAWLASGRELVPGVTERPLGACVVDWHSKIGALVLGGYELKPRLIA